MAIPGQSVFADLRRSYDRLMQSGTALAQQSTATEGRLKELLGDLDRTTTQLAKHYLPELTPGAIAGTFAEVRQELQGILAQKERAREDLERQIQALLAEQASLRGELDDVTARLNAKVQEREKCEARLAERLAADPRFQQLSTQLARSEEQLAQNERRLKEVEQEAAEKLPAYDRNSLFTYLHRRGYGSAQYRASNLITRLDRWVAELIGYLPARRSYEFLTLTPRLMAQELERRRAESDKLAAEVESQHASAAQTVGLAAILQEGQALGAQRDRVVARQSQLVENIHAAEKQRADLASTQNEFYERGVNRLREFLRRAKTELLERRAQQTPDPGDDPLVAQVTELTCAIDDSGRDLKRFRGDQQDLASQATTLRSILDRFQQSNYDAERSIFSDGFDTDGLLTSFLNQRIDGAMLWHEIAAHQQFRPMRSEWIQAPGGAAAGGGVLLDAILQAAGAAMEQSARRGAARHWGPSNSFPPIPMNFPSAGGGGGGFSRPSGGGTSPPRGGGFTTGDGF